MEGEKIMKNPFTNLTKSDVENLRRKSMGITSNQNFIYDFTDINIKNAKEHLGRLYPKGTVRTSFAVKILTLNEIY